MGIYLAQIYVEPGVSYRFSYKFQLLCGGWLTDRVSLAGSYTERFGEGYDLMFRMSAKSEIESPLVKGPTVFAEDRDVEYTIFLPFITVADQKSHVQVLDLLLSSIVLILNELGCETKKLTDSWEEFKVLVVADPTMFHLTV